jgi:aspartate racemase
LNPPLIGILAGMGPRSTAPFIDLVIDECQKQYGARHDIDFPRMMICSQPVPFYEDRPVDHAALEAATQEGLVDLDRAGCSVLAIACNTAHIYYPSLARAVQTAPLNIVDLAVASLPTGTRKVALIAARATMESGIYQTALDAAGFDCIDPGWQDDVDRLLGATRETTDVRTFATHWHALFNRAEAADADTILVACLGLSGILKHAPDTLPIADAAAGLAAAIVREWLAQREQFLKAAA